MTARLTGMKATQFFLGFGPRLWSFRRGETEYGVRALPLGAFVRIIGMNNMDEVPPADEARTYRQKSYPRRMLVITAGSLMHMLIAIVLLFTVYVDPRRARRARRAPRSARRRRAVRPTTPASQTGDIVVSVDGVAVDGSDELGERCGRTSPATSCRRRRCATASELTIDVGLGSNTDEASPTFGTALLGVSSRGAGEWRGDVARRGRRVQRHRPVPDGVGVDEGRRQGAQPGQHLATT